MGPVPVKTMPAFMVGLLSRFEVTEHLALVLTNPPPG